MKDSSFRVVRLKRKIFINQEKKYSITLKRFLRGEKSGIRRSSDWCKSPNFLSESAMFLLKNALVNMADFCD